jgi:hypothetical protein
LTITSTNALCEAYKFVAKHHLRSVPHLLENFQFDSGDYCPGPAWVIPRYKFYNAALVWKSFYHPRDTALLTRQVFFFRAADPVDETYNGLS